MRQHQPNRLLRWMKSFMLHHIHGMLTCREFEEFVMGYHDGELSKKQLKLFQRHLYFCRECSEYVDAYTRSIEVGKRLFDSQTPSLPNDVPDDLIRSIIKIRKEKP